MDFKITIGSQSSKSILGGSLLLNPWKLWGGVPWRIKQLEDGSAVFAIWLRDKQIKTNCNFDGKRSLNRVDTRPSHRLSNPTCVTSLETKEALSMFGSIGILAFCLTFLFNPFSFPPRPRVGNSCAGFAKFSFRNNIGINNIGIRTGQMWNRTNFFFHLIAN